MDMSCFFISLSQTLKHISVMKRILSTLVIALMAITLTCSCDILFGEEGSGSNELAGTSWKLDNQSDPVYYGAHVVYLVTIGKTNEFTFTRTVDGTEYTMKGTYDYDGGKGKAYLYNTYGDDQTSEYWLTFTVSGDTMVLTYSLRDVTLTKVK